MPILPDPYSKAFVLQRLRHTCGGDTAVHLSNDKSHIPYNSYLIDGMFNRVIDVVSITALNQVALQGIHHSVGMGVDQVRVS